MAETESKVKQIRKSRTGRRSTQTCCGFIRSGLLRVRANAGGCQHDPASDQRLESVDVRFYNKDRLRLLVQYHGVVYLRRHSLLNRKVETSSVELVKRLDGTYLDLLDEYLMNTAQQ